MSTLDRTDEFLLRALQEDRAAQRATSIEARLSHQRLADCLRRAVGPLTRLRPSGGATPAR
ncbi:MAG: hypothetical protein ACRYFW_06720 [Janthinobacterium lividum]